MLRATPPGEDGAPGRASGRGALKSPPPGEDGLTAAPDELENDAQDDAEPGSTSLDDDEEFDEQPSDGEFLQMIAEADAQALQYVSQVNRRSWERGYRAFHQEHFNGSKYTSDEYKNRSRLFIPKTRTAVRKDNAAVMASLFGSIDAVNCMPGNEGDAEQRASAAVMQELLNYRTDRADRKASIPWFHVAMGSRQTALFTGICLSKQSWKLELKRTGTEEFDDEKSGQRKLRDVWKPHIDRPNCELFPPENFTIDPAADWTNPAQDAAYVILKYPMRIDEIRRRQKDPRRPWKSLPDNVLRAAGEGARAEAEAIRRAREQGIDRFDKSQTTTHFDVVWVWETFVRTAGQDWTFMSIGSQHLLTDPAPTEQVYPEQAGERPLVMGYGSLEAFRIFPMSPVESWQMLQQESNDIRNLSLDGIKQNIMPVTKVVRGRNVDLDQLKRRGQGTSIMVTSKDDVTWEKVQSVGADVQAITQKLDIEFDDLSGQQNYGTVQDNNNLGKTLGGLKLAAGAANAVQEYDIRIWIETWCEPVLNQLVKLEQFYESDPIVLGLCADRAQLLQKHGVNEITDQLLENTVTVRVNVGLGSGDPQQRLAKFQSATSIFLPLAQMDPDFQSGKKQMDSEAIMQEIYGAAGYRDGGKRFVKEGQPKGSSPQQDAATDKLKSDAEKNRAMAKKAILDALSNAAQVGVQLQDLELDKARHLFDLHHDHVEQIGRAQDMGHRHGSELSAAKNAAAGLNPDGSPMTPPGEGGGPPAAAPGAGGADVPAPVQDAGQGNLGMDPAMLSQHSLPASDAGQQHQQDHAAAEAALAKSQKPKRRKVTIAKRGPDGRASEFHIDED
jgi:hypothetical protein